MSTISVLRDALKKIVDTHYITDARQIALDALVANTSRTALSASEAEMECDKAFEHAASFEGDKAMCAAAIATDIAAAIRALASPPPPAGDVKP